GLDGKEDSATAGIKENTFDAFGIVNTVASLDAAKLVSKVGLSQAAAKRLQSAQAGKDKKFGTYDDKPFITVKLLKTVGKLADADVIKLRDYARANGMVPKTVIRGPVVDESGKLAATFNGKMKAAGLPIFWTYMYLFEGKAGTAQYEYFTTLADRAAAKNIEVYVTAGPGVEAATADGKYTLCYQGDNKGVVNAASAGTSILWSEQLGIYGSRAGTETWIYEDTTEEDLMSLMSAAEKTAWTSYNPASTSVLLASDYSDSGDSISLTTINKCK
ncbi:MAG TPA: hypothetical protein PLF40_26960, partial [Kofleriaceae bacterium]|nr:hypothetical protein [Kofleriaceae bacterium]